MEAVVVTTAREFKVSAELRLKRQIKDLLVQLADARDDCRDAQRRMDVSAEIVTAAREFKAQYFKHPWPHQDVYDAGTALCKLIEVGRHTHSGTANTGISL